MRSIEVEEKNVDEAINKALERLQVSRDQVSVEILEEGSRGFFGLVGARPAKVRISVRQESSEHGNQEQLPANPPAEPPESLPPVPSAPAPAASENFAADANAQQIVTNAKQALQLILERLEVPYTVEVRKREEQILLNIHCENENFLIGRRGATLDAIQYLVNRIANKRATEKIQVVLDTSDYRVNRKERLQRLAVRLSKRVKMTGKPVTVSPMNPHDRRIIHLALQDDSDIRTVSKGTGFMRRIMIAAGRNTNRRKAE
jgi:spoIIIJ-associated protein